MESVQRARIISEALPYLRRFRGQTVVVKYGGAAMTDDALKAAVMGDVALLHYVGVHPVVVHGGGNEISTMCRQLGIEPRFVDGMRVTDDATMRVTEMVLGQLGKNIARLLSEHGAPAVGLSGKDASLLRARQFIDAKSGANWGLVGAVEKVNVELLRSLSSQGFVPVITPIGIGEGDETFNVNADSAAGAIAAALGASKLLLLTDVAGVYRDFNDKTSLIETLTPPQAEELISSGAVSTGMIPKIRCCLEAVHGGVEAAHIVDGRSPHSILIELFSDEGCGTMITESEKQTLASTRSENLT